MKQIDKIRDMNAEELAEILTKETKCCFCDDEKAGVRGKECKCLKMCSKYLGWREWLESEVEE